MKKMRKRDRVLSFFLAFCLIFTATIPSTILTAYAATTYKVTCTESGLNYGAGSQSTFERGDGTVVYCGEHDVYSPVDEGDSKSLSFSLYTNSKMVTKALYYGKGGPKEWSGFKNYTTKQAKCITALAVSNAYIDSGDAKSAAVKVDLDDVKGLKSFWNYIKGQSTPDTDRFEVYRYAGDAWTQSLFTFEYYPKGDGTLVKQSSHTYTTSGNGYYLKGAKYGVYKTKANANANQNKVGTLTTVAGGTSNTLTLDVGTYYVKETLAPEGFELDETVYTLIIKEDETTTLTVKDTPERGSLQIIKKSNNSNTEGSAHYSLKGAEFKVYRDKEKTIYVTTLTTDKDGKTNEFACIADTYYIYETKAPEGFKLYEDVITAKVTIGQKTEKTVTDEAIRGKIQIKKVSTNSNTDGNGNYSLKGAKFSIYRDKAKTKKVTTLTTDENGLTGTFTCIADTYYVYEDEAPQGFEKIEGLVGSFDTGESFLELGQDYLYTVNESPIRGKLQIVKESSDDAVAGNSNYTLKGAKFSIYRDKEKKDKVTTLVTDETGKTPEFTCIADTYYVYEDEAPQGFERIEGLVGSFDTGNDFLELKQDSIYTVVNEPIPGAIQIVKQPEQPDLVEGNENYSLEGAVFGVYEDEACTKLLKKLTTDANGKTSVFQVYAKTYYVKELKAPKGFKLNEKVFEAKVTVGNTKVVTVDEQEERGTVKVRKVTAGDKKNADLVALCPQHYTLEGAVYGIYSSKEKATAGKAPLHTLTTDANGDTNSVELPLGEYYIKEITPSKGYQLDENIYPVTVKANETVTSISEENPLFNSLDILLKKVDENQPAQFLADAEFTVRYYPELVEDTTGLTPTREWKFKTNEKGTASYCEADRIGGDPLFKDADGNPVGLIGTYEFIETKAPEGYLLNETRVLSTVQTNATQTATIYQAPIIENTPQKITITVQKMDQETGKTIPQRLGSFAGAVYEILKNDETSKENVVVDLLTTDIQGKATSKALAPGKYFVREVKAPAGYTINPELISVDAKTTDSTTKTFHYTVNAEEKPTTTEVNKFEVATTEYVKGAVLAVYDAEGKEIDRWTTSDEPHVFKALPVGTYTLKEISVPAGYVRAKDVTFAVEETGEIQKIVMEDDYIKVEFIKKDAATGEALAGVTLQLLDEKGTIIDEWVTTEEPHRIDRLPAGTYILHEVNALEGYLLADDLTFTVEETAEVQTIEMENDYTKVEISKSDITTGEPVIGAKLQILDSDENLVASWTTAAEPYAIKKLKPGKYTLVETYAPGEYVNAQSMEFEVKQTGELQKVEMKDDYTKVEIHKTDLVTGEPVIGAKLQIFDRDGKKVAHFTTTKEPYTIEKLEKGEYTLVETYAPGSYVTAKSINFTVEDTGEIQKVEMKDDFTKVEISKTDIVTGEPVIGATLQIHNEKDEVLYEWTTTAEPYSIERLKKGEYTLVETYAPGSYVTAKSVAFTVEDTGEIQKVKMEDDFTKIEILKTDADTGETVAGAELQIRNQDGDVLYEWVTTDKPYALERLDKGEYTLVEVDSPGNKGYVTAKPMKFTVTDTEALQQFELKNDHTKVELQKVDADTGKPIPNTVLALIPADDEGKPMEGEPYLMDTTDEYGKIYGEYLPLGKYVLKEVTANFNAGYVTADDMVIEIRDSREVQCFTMKDDHTKVEISKTDITTGNPVLGAELSIYAVDEQGETGEKAYATWTTCNEPFILEYIPVGEYILVEELTDQTIGDGYVTAEAVSFSVKDTGEIQKVEMKDDYTKVEILKTDVDTDEVVVGARLQIQTREGDAVYTWTTTEEPELIERLPVGSYTLVEISAPGEKGYVTAEPLDFVVKDTADLQEIEMKDDHTKVLLDKVDVETGEPIAKTELALIPLDEEGNPVGEDAYRMGTTDEHGEIYWEYVAVGKYILREVTANFDAGYVTAEDMLIEVMDTADLQKFTMKDDYTKVEFSKVDLETGEPVVGTRLSIIPMDEEGNPIWSDIYSTWETTEIAHIENYIPVGQYVLVEQLSGKAFDDGYVTAESVAFAVLDTGDVQNVQMVDDYTKVTVSKTDKITGEAVPGATLQILNSGGKVVHEWVTGDESEVIKRLPIGMYILVEKETPAGYVTSENIEFKIEDTGDMQYVEMKEDFTKVEIYKVEAGTNVPVEGAELMVRDEEGNKVLSFKSSKRPYTVENLPVGNYVLKEVSAPEGYELAEDVEFAVADVSQVQKVVMEDERIVESDSPAPETGDRQQLFLWMLFMFSALYCVVADQQKKRKL